MYFCHPILLPIDPCVSTWEKCENIQTHCGTGLGVVAVRYWSLTVWLGFVWVGNLSTLYITAQWSFWSFQSWLQTFSVCLDSWCVCHKTFNTFSLQHLCNVTVRPDYGTNLTDMEYWLSEAAGLLWLSSTWPLIKFALSLIFQWQTSNSAI